MYRRSWQCAILTLLACGFAADAQAQLSSTVYASGFSSPIAFVQDPTDPTVQLVVQQGGRVRVVKSGVVQPADFLDLRTAITTAGGEQGLLGLAFAPDYATSGRVFVNFTNTSGHTVIARFRRSSNPLVADPASRFDLRWGGPSGLRFIVQPFSNHNGGHLAFGPDGFLYIGLGDGGSGNDPGHRAQNPQELLGKMLRIDVNVADSDPEGYRVPSDNPFLDGSPIAARAEIWSFGLRNPWRYSFDDTARGGTGALVMGDVGQSAFEEIDYEPGGAGARNYGWRNREGAVNNATSLPPAYLPLTEPIHTYGRSLGQSVTGGYVYRGRQLGTAYVGRYFFADFVAGRIWSIALTIDPVTREAVAGTAVEHTTALGSPGNISSFGVDADGELYLVGYAGTIRRIQATPAAPAITTQPANQSRAAGATATFTAAASGAPVPTYHWQVSADGVSWTNVPNSAPYSGATTAALTVTTAVSLNGRRYRAIAANSAGTATSAAALLTVSGSMSASPAALQFAATKSGITLTSVTAAQSVRVSFSGAASPWSASADQAWLQLVSASGSGAGEFSVNIVNPGDVIGSAATLSGVVTIASTSNGALTIPVTLTVKQATATTAPFGAFDTPASGASVSGSLVVTGWALDDISVSRVEIWRDLAGGETTPPYTGPGLGQGRVFIANAFFVSGARPDIEAAHSGLPRASEAGWGYLLLTQGLWNQGNGTFTLHAFAYDADGHATTLGSKTITSNNAAAVKPFGAIDTPEYGAALTASFWNFGWALTPNATPSCSIGPAGVQVSIDSGPLQPVTYGDRRADIAAAFPGLTNTNGAGGAYYIDTTALSNGIHLIGWYVTDSCARAEGIGSRFFTVLNTGSSAFLSARSTITAADTSRQALLDPIVARRGLDVVTIEAGLSGEHVVTIAQDERVEIELPPFAGPTGDGPAAGAAYHAYQIVNGMRRGLPQGSTFDGAQGIFYWQPAPGFLGSYHFEFVRSDGGVVHARVDVAPGM